MGSSHFVLERDLQVVIVNLARAEETDSIVKECTRDDRSDTEQFKEGPELPLPPFV